MNVIIGLGAHSGKFGGKAQGLLDPIGRREITDQWLAQQLRPYGIRPGTLRIEDEVAKGYLRDDFVEVIRRYVPRSEIEAQVAEWRMRATEAQKPSLNENAADGQNPNDEERDGSRCTGARQSFEV